LRIAERLGLGQDGAQHLEGAVGLGEEPLELGLRLDLDFGVIRALVQEALGLTFALGRRQIEEREEILGLVMGAVGTESRITLLIDQPRRRIAEARSWILVGRDALGLEEQRPSRAESLEDIVQPSGDGYELG